MSTLEDATERLQTVLWGATTAAHNGRSERVLLFSGGLDSSVLAWMLRGREGVRLLTVGTPASHDIVAARTAAEAIGLPWANCVLAEADLRRAWDGWGRPLQPLAEPRRSVLFALGVLFEHAGPGTVLLGQGADELFGGYARFEGHSPEERLALSEAALTALVEHDWPATERLAASFGCTAFAPYLDGRVLECVRALPAAERFPIGVRKELLVRVARKLGMPSSLAERPKRALQYGSGIARFVARTGPASETRP